MAAGAAWTAGRVGSDARAPRFVVPPPAVWRWRGGELALDRPRVAGVVNLTPDSFSDGGRLVVLDDALEHAAALVEAGADLLDVGGESTRPGAVAVPADEQIRRILPFLRRATALGVPLAVDTRSAAVARAALEAGASIVNDVSGLTRDPGMGAAVAEAGAGLVLMHMRGEPATMGGRARYGDVAGEVRAELAGSLERARAAGVPDERVVLDPGLGFAKEAGHNWSLLADLDRLLELGRPLMVGPSRKRFLGELTGAPPDGRDGATAAACAMAYAAGARLFRVHAPGPTVEALRVAAAVAEAGAAEAAPGDEGDGTGSKRR